MLRKIFFILLSAVTFTSSSAFASQFQCSGDPATCRKLTCLQRLESRSGVQCGGDTDNCIKIVYNALLGKRTGIQCGGDSDMCIAMQRQRLGLDPAYEVCGVSGGN